MKKIYSLMFVVLLLMAANITLGQSTQVSPFSFSTPVDAGPQCSGGQIHDDGVAENGYGWNASAGDPSAFCTKFIPTGYPYKFSKYCIALTRLSTGVANWTFKIMMWKSVNGQPGVKMDSVTVTATAVPVWPTVTFFDFLLPGTWKEVTGTDSVFIGIVTNPVTQTGVFVASDESVTTPIWPAWATTAAGPWQSPTVLWTGYRAFLQRAEGSISGPPPMTNPTNMCAYTSAAVWSNFWGHGSDNMGDTLYVAGGSSTGAGSTTLYRYNIGSNTMGTNGAPIPESKAGHSFTKCGNSFYLIGGSTSASTGGTTCYKYTPSTGTWTSIAPLPVALSGHNAVNWGDSVIFVVSGNWAAPSTAVYAYRPASNTWITSTPLPAGTARRSAACGLTNGKIYLSCGYSAAFRNDLQIGTIGADASTITWAAGPVVPFLGGKTGTSRPGGTAVNGKFYLITGEVTPAPVLHDTIYVFDGATSTWSNIKGGRGGQAASNYWSAISNTVLPNGNIKIFIPGGSVTGGIGQLCCVQVPGCTVTNIGPIETPVSFSLSQNYPNPFNPTTKISYALPKSGLVTLKVYDILGKEVSTLVNEVKNAGTYTVDFSGSSLASGVYFYKLSVGDFTSVKKMTLLK